MKHIRPADSKDISRIAEILVFVKRINFRPIFQDDLFSFGELQVLSVAENLQNNPTLLSQIHVYDDGIVKALLHTDEKEIKQLYVDAFFQGEGIGAQLLNFAVQTYDVKFLWALEKNIRALKFYEEHGFRPNGECQYEEGTTERLIKYVR